MVNVAVFTLLASILVVNGGLIDNTSSSNGAISFNLHGYSRSNIPEIRVTFENGVQDDMVLEPYSNSPCNFIGQLKSNPGSVAVTGCLNTPEDKMHITLLSDLNTKSTGYELDFHGNVKAFENPFKYQKGPSGIFAPDSRSNDGYHKNNDEIGDELVNDADEEAAKEIYQTSGAVNWPTDLEAYLKFGYDNTMKAQLEKDGTTFAAWIDANMAHVQAYYRHDTLPSRINFKYDTAESIYKNENWPSTNHLYDAGEAGKNDGDPKVDLYVWFGKDQDYWGTIGLAWVGTACRTYYKTSFNEWRRTPVENAYVISHEMGHNFGMSHDFAKQHGGSGGKCDNEGIMSYGNAPTKWSTCSVADFTAYYEKNNWGTGCLKSEESVPTTPTPPTDPAELLNKCVEACRETGCRPDDDLKNGCNQMYSCSHACMIRHLGVNEDECRTHCDRKGNSGCWPKVNGYQFALCGRCHRSGCPKWPTPAECEIGCVNYA